MTTKTLSARPAPAVNSLSDLSPDEVDMAKPNVPILELRPHDGGLRRFAVVSLEPIVEAEAYAYDPDEPDGSLRVTLKAWERIDDRGWVLYIVTNSPSSGENYLGVSVVSLESALRLAWDDVKEAFDSPRMQLPTVLLKPVRDYVAAIRPPEIE